MFQVYQNCIGTTHTHNLKTTYEKIRYFWLDNYDVRYITASYIHTLRTTQT